MLPDGYKPELLTHVEGDPRPHHYLYPPTGEIFNMGAEFVPAAVKKVAPKPIEPEAK